MPHYQKWGPKVEELKWNWDMILGWYADRGGVHKNKGTVRLSCPRDWTEEDIAIVLKKLGKKLGLTARVSKYGKNSVRLLFNIESSRSIAEEVNGVVVELEGSTLSKLKTLECKVPQRRTPKPLRKKVWKKDVEA